MDDVDRMLELQLRRKLDAVVATPAPLRRGRLMSGRADSSMKGYRPVRLWLDRLILVERS